MKVDYDDEQEQTHIWEYRFSQIKKEAKFYAVVAIVGIIGVFIIAGDMFNTAQETGKAIEHRIVKDSHVQNFGDIATRLKETAEGFGGNLSDLENLSECDGEAEVVTIINSSNFIIIIDEKKTTVKLKGTTYSDDPAIINQIKEKIESKPLFYKIENIDDKGNMTVSLYFATGECLNTQVNTIINSSKLK